MVIKVSSKGQTVIPRTIREAAQIRSGDELDVGFAGGLVVMRKRLPLTSERVAALLRAGRRLPEPDASSEAEVSAALDRVRRRAGA